MVTFVLGVLPILFLGRPALTTSTSNSKMGKMGTGSGSVTVTSTEQEQRMLISFQSKGSRNFFFLMAVPCI